MKPIQCTRLTIQLGLLFVLCSNADTSLAENEVIHLRPGGDFEKVTEALEPGDTLIVHEGTYSGLGWLAITVQGTADQPVVIRAAEGEARPLITRPDGKRVQNTINIHGAAYLTVQGLEITGNGGDGVKVNGDPCHHIVLQDLVIHNVDVGINTKNNSHDFIIRGNHIYDTGINGATGEGMYIGCHNGSCGLSDSLIENNLIHDTLPGTSQGDGIEVKFNSQNIIIRNNVVFNRPYPGIFVYGGGMDNIVEGNVVWNSLEGISAVSDAIVRNNIVFDNKIGLLSIHHRVVPDMGSAWFINNTVYNNETGVMLRWKDASNMKFANNAVYSQGQIAVDSCTLDHPVMANITVGEIRDFGGCSTASDRFIPGRSAKQDFTDVAGHNFWPTASSPLVAAANLSLLPKVDFNNSLRAQSPAIGAYAYDGHASNPGWPISDTFKDPVITTDAVPVPPPQPLPRPGLWWNPAVSGHGLDIQLIDNTLSVVWYTYDSTGKPIWYLGRSDLSDQQWQADLELYSFNGSEAEFIHAGQLSLVFTDKTQGTFSWTLDGNSGSEPIEYFLTASEAVSGADYTGTWYEPAHPDYGMTVSIQGSVESTILYFYDDEGAPVWALGSTQDPGSSYRLKTYQGFCPGCQSVTLNSQDAGSVTPQFDSDAAGSLSVNVNLAPPLSGLWEVSGAKICNLASEETPCTE